MAGQWIQVTAVYDVESGLRSLYINGMLDVQIADSGVCGASTHNVYIGARANSDNTGPEAFFYGMIFDDVRVFNRCVSAGSPLTGRHDNTRRQTVLVCHDSTLELWLKLR